MTRSNVHEAIQRLDPSKRFRVLAFCVIAGIELEDFEDILAEAFTKNVKALSAVMEMVMEDISRGIARKAR